MFTSILSQISKHNVTLIKPYRIGNGLINTAIFGKKPPTDLYKYKEKFTSQLNKKKNKLEAIWKTVDNDNEVFLPQWKKVIRREIDFILGKIEFLIKIYDTEAQKIDPNYPVEEYIFDYDQYNKQFFGVTQDDIHQVSFKANQAYEIFFSYADTVKLLVLSKKLIPNFDYKFSQVSYMSHANGTLQIPKKDYYTIKEIITLFFHENTHFFREYNQVRNLGFSYNFSDYSRYEEGIALYNEYYYGKKLLKKYHYNPYYDRCYQIMLSDISEEQKQKEIYKILIKKGYTKEKSLFYYYRFYRYAHIGSHKLFLKDLIYTQGYKKVCKLIEKDPHNYERLMAGRIGPIGLKNHYIPPVNNFDTKKYFETILKKIQEKI